MNMDEIKQKVESYGKAYDLLVEAVKEFPREMWHFKPAPDRWSIHEIIIHIGESEANSFGRFRKIIAEPGGLIAAYDQDRWASELLYSRQNPDDAIELFGLLRKATYNLLKMLPDSIWERKGNHSDMGELPLTKLLDMYEGHIPGHINQMRGVYEIWQKTV